MIEYIERDEEQEHGRLIDADALLLRLLTAESGKVYDYCYPCREVLQAIKDSPTINAAAKRKHGKWISMMGHSICNVCGYKGSPILTNFCPNCGARMVTDDV